VWIDSGSIPLVGFYVKYFPVRNGSEKYKRERRSPYKYSVFVEYTTHILYNISKKNV